MHQMEELVKLHLSHRRMQDFKMEEEGNLLLELRTFSLTKELKTETLIFHMQKEVFYSELCLVPE